MTDATVEIIDLAPPRGWVTSAVIAALFDIHPRKVQRMAIKGGLPITAVRIGREWRFPVAQLNRYLIEHGDDPLTEERIETLEEVAAERWGRA